MNTIRYYLKIIILISFIVSTNGCMRSKTSSREDYGNTKVIETYKSFFTTEPFKFFSTKLYNQKNFLGVINPSALYAEGYSGLYFKQTLNEPSFKSMVTDFTNKSIFISHALDSINYFMPNYKETSPQGKFPIPNLNDHVYTIKDSLDMKNSKILILNNNKGQFFNKKGKEEVNMFADIDSTFVIGKGYSNGAIIDFNKKTIIYWVIIW